MNTVCLLSAFIQNLREVGNGKERERLNNVVRNITQNQSVHDGHQSPGVRPFQFFFFFFFFFSLFHFFFKATRKEKKINSKKKKKKKKKERRLLDNSN